MGLQPTRTHRRRSQSARRIGNIEAMEHRALVSESLGILVAGIGVPAAVLAGRPTAEGAGQAVQPRRPTLAFDDQLVLAMPRRPIAPAAAGGGGPASPESMPTTLAGSGVAFAALDGGSISLDAAPRPNVITTSQPVSSSNAGNGGGASGTSHGGSGSVTPGPSMAAPTPESAQNPPNPGVGYASLTPDGAPGATAGNTIATGPQAGQATHTAAPSGLNLPAPTVSPTPAPPASTPPAATTPVASAHTSPTIPTSPVVATPTPVTVAPPTILAVGGYLDESIIPGGLAGSGVTYTITPQPLPTNMTFDRATGELTFAPAPGQVGAYRLLVTANDGTQSAARSLLINVDQPVLASTEVSGQVVDEAGKPLAHMPVSIGGSTATTDARGDFTLTSVPAVPGPISAGGAVATAQGRQALIAPLAQLLGHDAYADSDNVIAQPLILPEISWTTSATFSHADQTTPLAVTNPALPGFAIQQAAGTASDASSSGTLKLAQLPASVSAQHMAQGLGGGLLLYQATGIDLTRPVVLTLPNTGGLKPGAMVSLLTVNMQTGGHDVAGQMVVSADGRTMTSTSPILLAHAAAPSAAPTSATQSNNAAGTGGISPQGLGAPVGGGSTGTGTGGSGSGSGGGGMTFSGCLEDSPDPAPGDPTFPCSSCPTPGSQVAATGNTSPGGSPANNLGATPYALASDVGMVDGEYFLDHQTVTYQSQGQAQGIDLLYNSGQADPAPVAQYEFTTPIAGDSSSITSINAQISLAGVVQGAAVTYNTPGGLTDGETYNIPLQVAGSALATGSYPYKMTVTENFGSGAGAIPITTVSEGYVNVVNASSDPLGAGWSVGGLQQVYQPDPSGPALVTPGQQGAERLDQVYTGGGYFQDLAASSAITGASVLANDGTGKYPTGTDSVSGSTTVGTATGDLNGDGKPDLAVLGQSTLQILLNNGSGGLTAGSSIGLPSGYVGKAVAVGNFSGHANGTLDVAVLLASTSTGAYAIAEYTGAGNGSFSSAVVSSAGNGDYTGSATPDTIVATDFNGDGLTDLAFTTDDGKADVMLATGGGSFGSAAALALPSGDLAIGITSADYNQDGKPDLIVQINDTNVSEPGAYYDGTFAGLAAFAGNGSGGFSYTSSFVSVGHPDLDTYGIVAGDFNGTDSGLEVALPITSGDVSNFVDIVPLSTSGTWSAGTSYAAGAWITLPSQYGNIVAADLDGSGKPSIALTDGSNQAEVLLADPDSNSILPLKTVNFAAGSGGGGGSGSGGGTSYENNAGMLAVAPFMGTVATPGYRGTPSDTSTLVHNANGTWTHSYPDGTVYQFNSSGQENSEADRNGNVTSYTYVPSGQPGAGALQTITDPVGLVTTLAYDSNGHLNTITDTAGRVTTITIDSNDNLDAIEDPDGAVERYGYATPSNHEATSETDPRGYTATAHYNSFGQFSGETLFDGTSTTTAVSAQSNGLLSPGGSGTLPTAYQATITDPDGRTTTLTLNRGSHPTGEADATGATTSYGYANSPHAEPTTETDALGRTTTYTYDNNGNVTSITQPAPGYATGSGSSSQGGTTTETIAYNDPYGVPTSITDFNGITVTFALDSRGDILAETYPDGLSERWTYNSAGQVLTDTTRGGNTTTYAYDAEGRLTTISYPGPGSPQGLIHYDAAGDVTSITDPNGSTITYTYDPAGRVTSEQDPTQAAAGKATTFAYDADGDLIAETDALGHVTTYSYSARDQLVGMTDAANQGTGRQTVYGYDADGNLTSVTDQLGHATTYAYDQDNREAGMTDPDGNHTTYTYDLDGELVAETSPNGNATSYTYDNDGCLHTEILPSIANPTGAAGGSGSGSGGGYSYSYSGPATYTYAHDADGDLTAATDPNGHTTTYTYNSLNQGTAVTDPLGHATSYTYTPDGQKATVTDPLGHVTTYAYDALDRLVSGTDPSGGGTTTYTYDLTGNLTSVTDPVGNVTSYTYNADEQEATQTSPNGGVTTYTYDQAGNLTQTVDPLGRIIQYGYDADNRETTEQWLPIGGGTAFYTMTITYDAAGRETEVQDNSSEYTYGYNGDNQVTSVNDAGTPGLPQVTLTYGYDGDGNRTSLSDSLGGVVSYAYDARDELNIEAQSGTNGVAPELALFNYDQAGNLSSLARFADTAATTTVATTTDSYDAADRLTTTVNQTASGSTISTYAYTLDAANRLTSETRTWAGGVSSDTANYNYTNDNQLTSVTHANSSFATETLSYDANGNRNSSGYSTGTGNEPNSDGTYNYTYDADGNLITKTAIATGVEAVYSYDYRNRLVEIQQVSGGVATTLAQYTYDALNNLIKVVEGGSTRYTLYDGQTPLLDFNGSGQVTARYLSVPGVIDELLARQTSSGVAWYLTDRNGSVADIINNSGTVIDHVDYSAYGTVLDESSPSNGDRFKYAGMEYDAAIGLYYDRARWYSPALGRFVVQDPSSFNAGDSNLYRFTGNDPVDNQDPSGLQRRIDISPPGVDQNGQPTQTATPGQPPKGPDNPAGGGGGGGPQGPKVPGYPGNGPAPHGPPGTLPSVPNIPDDLIGDLIDALDNNRGKGRNVDFCSDAARKLGRLRDSLNDAISQLQAALADLQSDLASAGGDQEKADLRKEIRDAKNKIRQSQGKVNRINNALCPNPGGGRPGGGRPGGGRPGGGRPPVFPSPQSPHIR